MFKHIVLKRSLLVSLLSDTKNSSFRFGQAVIKAIPQTIVFPQLYYEKSLRRSLDLVNQNFTIDEEN